jgi:hypothetical protein
MGIISSISMAKQMKKAQKKIQAEREEMKQKKEDTKKLAQAMNPTTLQKVASNTASYETTNEIYNATGTTRKLVNPFTGF